MFYSCNRHLKALRHVKLLAITCSYQISIALSFSHNICCHKNSNTHFFPIPFSLCKLSPASNIFLFGKARNAFSIYFLSNRMYLALSLSLSLHRFMSMWKIERKLMFLRTHELHTHYKLIILWSYTRHASYYCYSFAHYKFLKFIEIVSYKQVNLTHIVRN